MGQYSLGDDSGFVDDYTQLVSSATHTISNGDNVNDGDEQRNVTVDKQGVGI